VIGTENGVIVDAHFHLWDPQRQRHSWLEALPALNRRFGPCDFEAAAGSEGVGAGVLVQALANTDETHELLALANEHELIAGVVGWVDLERPDVAEQLEHLRSLPGGERLVGIRHLVQDEPDVRWLLRDDVGRGLEALGRTGLVYDLLIRPKHLDGAVELAAGHPAVSFVLDHGAKPAIAAHAFEPWASILAKLCLLPNVACKVSGLVTEAAAGWNAAQIGPYLGHLLDCFGPQRLLFGSDWPVCTLAASYTEVLQLTRDTLAPRLTGDELDAVFRGNAIAQYRLLVRSQ
jgi:L-fuconolactonase